MDLMELKHSIFQYGIVGAGGAGFPTQEKINENIDVVILNCAECEPLFRVDRQLLRDYAENILSTLAFIVDSVKAAKGIVAIKSVYKEARAAVEEVIYKYRKLEIKILPDVYPMGDEAVLVYEVTGKIAPEGAIPLAVGAMVLNVETVLNLYKGIYLNEPVTDKYVTVTGAVQNPVTVKVPIGISIKELIKYAGGPSIDEYEILKGGPMTGRLAKAGELIDKTTKAVIVLPKEHPIILKRKEKASINLNRIKSVCSQCQMCTDLCPRHLLGHNIKPNRMMKVIGHGITSDIEAYTMSMLCSECGLCEVYACHQGLSPRRIIGELKAGLRGKGIKNPHTRKELNANVLRDGRMVPMERLIARLGISKYDVKAPLIEKEMNIKLVEILLKQHIGAVAIPKVQVGERVKKGQLIGEVSEGKLGSKIHASIDGQISKIYEDRIIIEHRGEENE